jgi:hypothetical protein
MTIPQKQKGFESPHKICQTVKTVNWLGNYHYQILLNGQTISSYQNKDLFENAVETLKKVGYVFI